ncbi:hypothetical protein RFI_21295 [Reticulomyxa filosa]|uniref:Uncharacterized protein n=1 Tax=Reticulomyxa filosa TaxID=46433 RepID=X6MQD9_RETFI|nr:hypothetical protein RFI_21295 [Reticulomyxa filosa]|eukprot:ETO16064.1 hypothetical protein RFI_21295 [Reticulomyxa filosa]
MNLNTDGTNRDNASPSVAEANDMMLQEKKEIDTNESVSSEPKTKKYLILFYHLNKQSYIVMFIFGNDKSGFKKALQMPLEEFQALSELYGFDKPFPKGLPKVPSTFIAMCLNLIYVFALVEMKMDTTHKGIKQTSDERLLTPFIWVDLPNEEIIHQICSRSLLVRFFVVLYSFCTVVPLTFEKEGKQIVNNK